MFAVPRLRLKHLVCVLAAVLLVPASALAAGKPAKRSTVVNGGTGIPSAPKTRHRRRSSHTRTRTSTHSRATTRTRTSTRTTTTNSGYNDGVTAPVKRDGGSQHLGERTLRQGMTGHDVRVLQSYLSLAGYATPVDGQFGATTESSVLSFEAAHNLPANGVISYADSLVLRQTVVSVLTGGPVGTAKINSDGTATAPAGAPAAVVAMIAAANRIIDTSYVYGGGHQSFNARGYDCSGAVSYALHGAGLLASPEDSSGLESFGAAGPGRWVTVYADAGHAFIDIAGIAFDTANYGGPNIPSGDGPRWRTDPTGNLADGGSYVVRHPSGL